MTLRNLLHKGTFGAQMVDLGLPQIVQNLKAHAWSDEVGVVFYSCILLIDYLLFLAQKGKAIDKISRKVC